jgi:hypothetical protein
MLQTVMILGQVRQFMIVIASAAKQSRGGGAPYVVLDCFVASLLAMTTQ